MDKIMITGANGLLGQHLVKQLKRAGYSVIATGKGEDRLPMLEGQGVVHYFPLDITDEAAVETIMRRERPDVVVHAAAVTQVDECELNRDKCFSVNVEGTANIIVHAERYACHLVYISTDFVFDGERGNYAEDDALNPISWYGFTKAQAESTVETCEIPWTIVRTCLVYGNVLQGSRSNIITWVKEKLEKKEKIRVVSDQWRTPTYVADLARGILLIIEKKARGIFHISGKDTLTPYDIALKTADHFGLDKGLVEKVDATVFSQPGKRPPRTGFLIGKARTELGYEPLSFDEGVKEMWIPS
jgi:dTDP-4-dehydrorhamnose reductase